MKRITLAGAVAAALLLSACSTPTPPTLIDPTTSVSYTHLTLPTILLV